MLPILQIGSLAVQVPGLVVLAGLWLGLSLAERKAQSTGLPPDRVYNLALIALLAGAAGARLAYAARYPSAFLASPASLLSPNPGLLDPFGALAGGLLAALIYGQRKGLPLWKTLDTLSPALAVVAVAAALANLASGSGFGAPASVPWAIELWGARRHPSQIYEALAAAAILWWAWPRKTTGNVAPEGAQFLQFSVLSAAARLFLEAFRGDSTLIFGGLRQAQVLAWIVLAAGLWALRPPFTPHFRRVDP